MERGTLGQEDDDGREALGQDDEDGKRDIGTEWWRCYDSLVAERWEPEQDDEDWGHNKWVVKNDIGEEWWRWKCDSEGEQNWRSMQEWEIGELYEGRNWKDENEKMALEG